MKRFVVVLVLAMLVATFGTNLVAAASTSPAAPAATHNIVYTVVYGDTLAKIAHRYGTTAWAIWHANPWIKNPNLIYPGQKLLIPVPGPAPQPTTVKVGLIALNANGGVGCGDGVVL